MKSSAPFQELRDDSVEMIPEIEEERQDCSSEVSAVSSLLHSSVQKSHANYFKPSSLKVFKGSTLRGMKMKFRQHRRTSSVPEIKLQGMEAEVLKQCREQKLVRVKSLTQSEDEAHKQSLFEEYNNDEHNNDERNQEDLSHINESVNNEVERIDNDDFQANFGHFSSTIDGRKAREETFEKDVKENQNSPVKNGSIDNRETLFENDAIDRKDSLSSDKSSILLDLIRFEGAVKSTKHSELISTKGEEFPKVITVVTEDEIQTDQRSKKPFVSTQPLTLLQRKQRGCSSVMEDTIKEDLKVNLFGSTTETPPMAKQSDSVIVDPKYIGSKGNEFYNNLDALKDLNISPVLDISRVSEVENEVIKNPKHNVESKITVQSLDAEINTSFEQEETDSIKELCSSTVHTPSSVETPLPAKELLFQREMLKTQERQLFKRFMEEFTPKKVNTSGQTNKSPKDFMEQLRKDFTPKHANGDFVEQLKKDFTPKHANRKERQLKQSNLKSIQNSAEYGAWDFEDFGPFWEDLKTNLLKWQSNFHHVDEISDNVITVCPGKTYAEVPSDEAPKAPSLRHSGIELEYRPPRTDVNLRTNGDQDGIISVDSEDKKSIELDEASKILRNLPSMFSGSDNSIEHEVKDGEEPASNRNNPNCSGDSLAAFLDHNQSMLSYGSQSQRLPTKESNDNPTFEEVSFPSPSFNPNDHNHSHETRNEHSFELDALVSSFLADVQSDPMPKMEDDLSTSIRQEELIGSKNLSESAIPQENKEEVMSGEEKDPNPDLKVLDQLLTLIGSNSNSKDESILSNEAVDIIKSIRRLSKQIMLTPNRIEEREENVNGELSRPKKADMEDTTSITLEKRDNDAKVTKTAQTRKKRVFSSTSIKGGNSDKNKNISPTVSTERSYQWHKKNYSPPARCFNNFRSPQDIMNFPSSPNIQKWPSISERIAAFQCNLNHNFNEHTLKWKGKEVTDTYEI